MLAAAALAAGLTLIGTAFVFIVTNCFDPLPPKPLLPQHRYDL